MIQRNILANIVSRVWGVASIYLFVPLYLKFLGIEAFGLVGFYSTLLSVLTFADMGFTATLTREMARLSVRKDSTEEMRDLLRTYEITYGCISFLLAILIWSWAPLITESWLHSGTLAPGEVTATIRAMGVSIALQLPSGLYIGGLMGLQRQVLANSLQIGWSILRGLGAILILSFLSNTIFAFALWQLVANGLYCGAAHWSLWRALSLGKARRPQFKWLVFRQTKTYAGSMIGMTLISTLLTQADKLVISRMLSLETLGYYTLAGTLASVPLMFASPIALAASPRFTGLVAIGDHRGLTDMYHKTCTIVAVAVIPGALTLGAFAGDFIFAWTGSSEAAHRTGLVAPLLLIGQLAQAILIVPYYVALAHGNLREYLMLGFASAVLITPILTLSVWRMGIVGAGLSWLLMNLCTLPLYVFLFHRRFLPGEAIRWCLSDTGLPLLGALPCVLLGRILLPHSPSRIYTLCLIAMVWFMSAVATVSAVPYCRRLLKNATRQWLVTHSYHARY